MILYFSGTGNSEYAAKRIGRIMNEDTVNLFEKIRKHDFSKIHSDSPWVIAAPTYAWRIPRILDKWLREANLEGSREIYFVMTCGGSIGNAEKYLKQLCQSKNMKYSGCFPVVMPENYIAMYPTPAKAEALEIIRKAESEIDKAADLIKNGRKLPQRSITLKDKISSSVVNDIFYPVFVHAKKFYAEDTCISCGKCANVCPMDNIRMKNGKPVWGKDCTHCMACISKCPREAIEYGKKSRGMERYTCPK